MATYNVRCCCDPGKILGTLEIDIPPSYDRFFFMKLEIPPNQFAVDKVPEVPTAMLEGQLRIFQEATGETEKAVFSDDQGIEYWRQFPTFIEGARV